MLRFVLVRLPAIVLLLFALPAAAGPEVGERAPAFALPGSDGKQHALADHLDQGGVVLAWFPKAFTPG